MKKAIRTKWLEALRSGKYIQGKGLLHPTIDTYCCLGVLCDILKDDLKGNWESVDSGLIKFKTQSSYREVDLSNEVRIYTNLGIGMGNSEVGIIIPSTHKIFVKYPKIKRHNVIHHNVIFLTTLNDWGVSFNDIADLIEEFIPEDPDETFISDLPNISDKAISGSIDL